MPRESGASSNHGRRRFALLFHAQARLLDRPLSRTMTSVGLQPRTLMHRYRTHTCGALRAEHIGSTVRLSGWCHRIRDHGGLLFIDLRDHYGLTQIVADPDSPAFKTAEKLRSEWVIRIDGRVRVRPAGTDNAELPTGAVEVFATDIEVLGPAGELPMPVFGDQEYPEEVRLKYRFLDLRRERLHRNIIKRGAIIDSLRRRMKEQGFFEFQTPILTASSPEGARDFLVPSRIHPGKFYALPQAPQQFKQLIMVSGFDRYFQIAPCFRDEDARADRSPGEFYQLDVEMSFVTQEDVFAAVEPVLRGVFEEFAGGKPVTPQFPQISYAASIRAFGTDKPDLRNPLMIHDVTNVFRDSGFGLFARAIAADPLVRVWAIPAPKGGSRAFCDRMDGWAKGEGQHGLGYIFWRDGDESGAGPIAKNIGPERASQLKRELNGRLGQLVRVPVPFEEQDSPEVLLNENFPLEVANKYRHLRPDGLINGDAVFFVMGRPKEIYKFAGLARTKVGEELNLAVKDCFEFCWIINFPMYEWSEEEKKIDFSHNPFSMPNYPLNAFLDLDPKDVEEILKILAIQYDIVCNGIELSSGAIRNHRPDVMKKAFAIAGYDESVLEQKFGGMLRALSLGAPPHGGIAPGVDRIVMLLCGEENLREVVVFPMNQRAEDLLMGAPSEVTAKQLRELHIRLNLPQ
jgi:aspartyl-tRNA synthetase